MGIYRFLDSKDIRAHLQSLRYDFTLPEAAFLIWQCATAPCAAFGKARCMAGVNQDHARLPDGTAAQYV